MAASKGGSSSTSTTRALQPTVDWYKAIKTATEQAANGQLPGVGAGANQAGGLFNTLMGGAAPGLAALSGDANALAGLMNPYQSQVIDATNADFDRSAALTGRGVDDAATMAGAFGGSRHGVAAGVAGGEVERARNSALANIRTQGFQDAMGRAGQLVNFGMGGAQGALGFDEYTRNVANMQNRYRMDTLKTGLMGLPSLGQTTKGNSSSWNGSFSIPFFGGSGGGKAGGTP